MTPAQEAARRVSAELLKDQHPFRIDLDEQDTVRFELAVAFADFAIALTPVIGPVKDAFEFSSGTSILTGRNLTEEERVIAAVGLLSLSAMPRLYKMARVLASSAADTEAAGRILIKAEVLAPKLSFLRVESRAALGADFKILKIHDVVTVNEDLARGIHPNGVPFANAPVVFPPFQNVVTEVGSSKPERLARLSSSKFGNAFTGRFLVDPEDIAGLSGMQIQARLNLSYVPDVITVIEVPAGRTFLIGELAPVPPALNHGSRQFFITSPLEPSWAVSSSVIAP